MMNAQQARERSKNTIQYGIEEEMWLVEELVEKATGRGEFVVTSSGNLHKVSMEALRALGYTVENCSQYNEPYFRISWRAK